MKYKINDDGRIEALRDFGNVKKGDVGGFVRSEKNLSHDGDCWVYDDAWVTGFACVFGSAKVCGNALVSGWAYVYGDALVSGGALVTDHAHVCGKAKVFGRARVAGNAEVSGDARVCDDARVSGDARVFGNTYVYGNDRVSGKENDADDVNSPEHYREGAVECIDAIESALTEEEFRGYCKGNVLKYTWRERHKEQDKALKKAQWYLRRLTDD